MQQGRHLDSSGKPIRNVNMPCLVSDQMIPTGDVQLDDAPLETGIEGRWRPPWGVHSRTARAEPQGTEFKDFYDNIYLNPMIKAIL